ncbi:MAG: LAGLIDADG family homing endonuclease [Candidatus Paceibacterota bacterium]
MDNFKAWREEQKKLGKIPSEYLPLEKNGDLAELIGLTLGDGSIHKYARTEGLRIVLPANKPKLVSRGADLVYKVFGKKPSVIKRKNVECFDIRFYQKAISERLGIPIGSRGDMEHTLPEWIMKEKSFMIRYLRGLYEAEGSHCAHLPTYTHKLIFTNVNQSLLKQVKFLLETLGFHPHVTKRDVQVSRKKEVEGLIEVLQFRKY